MHQFRFDADRDLPTLLLGDKETIKDEVRVNPRFSFFNDFHIFNLPCGSIGWVRSFTFLSVYLKKSEEISKQGGHPSENPSTTLRATHLGLEKNAHLLILSYRLL